MMRDEATSSHRVLDAANNLPGRLGLAAACVLLLVAANSCGNSTGPGEHVVAIPARVDVIAGGDQQGTVGTELANPLVARVVDDQNNPIVGQIVNFRVTAGGGSVFAGSASTNADGIAQERWTLGTSVADSQKVEVRAVDASTGAALVFAVFRATAHADVPDTVRVISGGSQSTALGAALADSLLVRVVDRYGNPVPGGSVTWTGPVEAGTLSRTTDLTTAAGFASTKLTAGTHAGNYLITAGAGGRSSTFFVQVRAGPAATLTLIAGNGQTAPVNTVLPVDPAIRVLDSHGNPVARLLVAFYVTGGGGASGTSAETNDSGVAHTGWVLGRTAGANALLASAGPDTETFTATAIPGPAAQVTKIAGDNQAAVPGAAVAVAPAVRVADQFGNTVTGAHVHFAVAAGGGSVTGGDVTTDANGTATVGSWTLGMVKGVNTLTATAETLPPVSFTAAAGETSPDVLVGIVKPAGGAVGGDTLSIEVVVTSRVASLSSVHASVGTHQVDLAFSGGSWKGTLVIQGEPYGERQLTVTARNLNGAGTDAFATFIHDTRPTIIATPLDQSVVQSSTTSFVADCQDDNPAGCTRIEAWLGGDWVMINPGATLVATGTSHVAGTFNLAPYEGRTVQVTFIAYDSRGQQAFSNRKIHVESSTKLREIVSDTNAAIANAAIANVAIDVRGDRALYLQAYHALKLKNVTSGATEVIPLDTANGQYPLYGFVTATGAIFAVNRNTSPFGKVFEWRNGALVDLGGLNSANSLRVAGDYAIYSNGNSLTRRNLVTNETVTVSSNASNSLSGVAANGDVVFGTTDHKVYRYRAGTLTQLTPNDGQWSSSPLTDGTNVVYEKSTPQTGFQTPVYQIAFNDGSGEVILAQDQPTDPVPLVDPPLNGTYVVNAGWTAFMAVVTGNTYLWTRSPTGALRQFAPSGSSISALGSDGTVILQGGTRRSVVTPTGISQDIMSSLGNVRWRDGRFIVLIGRSVFELTP